MIVAPKNGQIFLYNNLVDGRWGADRLAHIVKKEMDFEPRSGGVFIFFNKAKTRAKLFFYGVPRMHNFNLISRRNLQCYYPDEGGPLDTVHQGKVSNHCLLLCEETPW